jgi:hypothetical protein
MDSGCIQFSDAEKIKNFEEISAYFFESNFGELSKTDIDLLMLSFYFNNILAKNKKSDGTFDYSMCSDYKISKELGITQQRVRNLKVKKQLKHPVEFDWQKSLAVLMDNAKYDEKTSKITINIPDPNLFVEIQNFIEEQGGYVEIQLNSKVLKIRVEYFLALVISIEGEENKDKILKEIKKDIKASNKDVKYLNEKNIGKSLIDLSLNVTTILANVTGLISPTNFLGIALGKLVGQ